MSETYPTGTNVREIKNFDRSIKVHFQCKEHPGPVYASKEPGWSSWFPANEQARDIDWGKTPDPCNHFRRDDVWVTASEYTA